MTAVQTNRLDTDCTVIKSQACRAKQVSVSPQESPLSKPDLFAAAIGLILAVEQNAGRETVTNHD